MRALTIRPDDAELFQNIADPERYSFFITHSSAFKRMWVAEGKVYWLRFLLTFKDHFETALQNRPEYRLICDMEDNELQSLVFVNIHKKFIHGSYSQAKTFVEQVFVVVKNLAFIREPNRIKNPFYAKESREAFRGILGKPEVDEDIPAGQVAFLCTIYSLFMGSVCELLKRWLKEPDLSEETKEGIDFTYLYWKPDNEWNDPCYWPSCFEKYLADVYKDALPKMLLTSDIHNIFLIHEEECPCDNQEGDISIFDLLRERSFLGDDDGDEEDESFNLRQVGFLHSDVYECASHRNCYHKILHDPKCPEPYLCTGSKICVITCEKTQKELTDSSKPTNFWKKVTAETFTFKGKKQRHVSTVAESHNTQIETFIHICQQDHALKKAKEDQEEFMMNMLGDPEFLNTFNQHKRKEDVKNRLRSKFNQRHSLDAKDFSDSDFCLNLYENAKKVWMMGMLDEKLHMAGNSDNIIDCHQKQYAEGSVFNSKESAETTVGVGTNSVLTGRIVLASSKLCTPSSCVCEEVKQELPIEVPKESKKKSKRSRSKRKKKASGNASNENDDPSTSTDIPTVNEAKQTPVQVSETKKEEIKKAPVQIPETKKGEMKKAPVQIPETKKGEMKKAPVQILETKKNTIKKAPVEVPDTYKEEIRNSFPLFPETIEDEMEKALLQVPETKKDAIKKAYFHATERIKDEVKKAFLQLPETKKDEMKEALLHATEISKDEMEKALLHVPETIKDEMEKGYLQLSETEKDAIKEEFLRNPEIYKDEMGKAFLHILETKQDEIKKPPFQVPGKNKYDFYVKIDIAQLDKEIGHVPLDLSATKIEKTKNLPLSSAENQYAQSNETPEIVKNVQHKNTSETSGEGSSIIGKAPSLVNKSDCDDSQNESMLLNGEIGKNAGDNVDNSSELCLGGCLTNNTVGHVCSKAVCSSVACCQGCVFIAKEKIDFSTETDTKVITVKPKKSNDLKVKLIKNPGFSNGKSGVCGVYVRKVSTNLKGNEVQIVKGDKNSKKVTPLEYSTILNNIAVQISKYPENSYDLATLENSVAETGSGDATTVRSIEKTSNDKCAVSEPVSNIPGSSSLHLNEIDNPNPIQEHVEIDSDLLKTDVTDIVASGFAASNDSENISETVKQEASAALDNLTFETRDDFVVEDFLTLIGVLKKPPTSEEEIKSASVSQTANHECDADGKDKKLKFKTCAFCGKKEIAYKTFKRCAKCKADNFTEQRYYCTRQCQVDDWQESHRDEHLKKN